MYFVQNRNQGFNLHWPLGFQYMPSQKWYSQHFSINHQANPFLYNKKHDRQQLPKYCSVILQPTGQVQVPIQVSGGAFIHPGPSGKSSMSIIVTLPEPAAIGLRRYDAYLLTNPPTGVTRQLTRVSNASNLWAVRIDDILSFNITADSVLFIGGSATESAGAPPGHRVILEGKLSNCQS